MGGRGSRSPRDWLVAFRARAYGASAPALTRPSGSCSSDFCPHSAVGRLLEVRGSPPPSAFGSEDGSWARARRGAADWPGLVVGLGAPAAGIQRGELRRGAGVEWGPRRPQPAKGWALIRVPPRSPAPWRGRPPASARASRRNLATSCVSVSWAVWR